MIKVSNISKKYGAKNVVNNVSLNIQEGKITSFIGPNGAGKSTVLGMVSRLMKQDSGTVSVNGVELSTWKPNDLSKVLAILKQSNHLSVRLSVRDLVAFGRFPHSGNHLTAVDEEKIELALNYMELKELEHHYLDELSGGQNQRAFIAMILAQDTDYILLDEPLNNLDMKHSVQIMKLLRKITDELGKTVVLVIHDINFASCYSDYIVALKNGEIVANASVDEIMQKPVLESIYEMDFEIQELNGKKICVYY
ncbi:MAG: ABC transporter ATP-binding protein [Turicibacter sp.]